MIEEKKCNNGDKNNRHNDHKIRKKKKEKQFNWSLIFQLHVYSYVVRFYLLCHVYRVCHSI